MGYLIDILIGAAGALVARELSEGVDAASQWLVRKAVQRLPRRKRKRHLDEWLADLHDMPSLFAKFSWAVGCHWAATVVNVHRWRAAVERRKLQETRTRLAAGVDLLKAAYSGTPSAFSIEIEVIFAPAEMRVIELGAIKYGCSPGIYVQTVVMDSIYLQRWKMRFARVLNIFRRPRGPHDVID